MHMISFSIIVLIFCKSYILHVRCLPLRDTHIVVVKPFWHHYVYTDIKNDNYEKSIHYAGFCINSCCMQHEW